MLRFAALILSLAASGLAAGMPDTRPRTDDAELRQALQDIRARHKVPGLAAAIFDAETIRAFGVGELAADGNPVTPDSRFRVGQVSLLYTGIAVAALTADGSLPADGELGRLAPEVDFHNPWSAERPVLIADLVTHRAGLGMTHFRDVYTRSTGQPLLAGINSAFRALRLEYRPGEREQYSIVGFAIAAYLAEKAAGFAYDELLARMVFRPLETPASLGRPSGPLAGDAEGHAGWPARVQGELPLNFPSAGDLWISADGLARTGQMLLNDGRFGEHIVMRGPAIGWLESAAEDAPVLVPGSRRGVQAEEFNGFLFFTQTGALPGFLARFAYSRELGAGYIVLLNHGDARAALAEAEQLLRGQLFAATPRPAAVPAPLAAPPRDIGGWYRRAEPVSPPERFYQSWLGLARVAACGDAWCFGRLGRAVELHAFDEIRLREAGYWRPGWHLRETDKALWLEHDDEIWQRVPAWQAWSTLALAFFVGAALLAAPVLMVRWGLLLWRLRALHYHQLLPRLVPLLALATLLGLQVLLFTIDYPALGEVGAASVGIVVLSVLGPLLTLAAVATTVAGAVWRLSWRTSAAAAALTLANAALVAIMASSGLLLFQSWNY